jgi:hypothetical protein
MISKLKFISIIILSFIIVPILSLAESFPDFPMAFWGNVTVNGASAPVGSVLKAYSNGVVVGEVTVKEAGVYGYTDSTKQKLLVGNATSSVTFSLQHSSLNNGAEINGSISEPFVSGSTVNKNLSFSFTIQTPSATRSGGGGGGGGGTVSTATTVPVTTLGPAAQKVDANKDNKIDVFDFNALMIHWGETNLNNIADFNKDNKVDIFDFNLLMIHWTG